MPKTVTLAEHSKKKKQSDNTNTARATAIIQYLRTNLGRSVNESHQTGVVKLAEGIPIFLPTTKAVLSKEYIFKNLSIILIIKTEDQYLTNQSINQPNALFKEGYSISQGLFFLEALS